MPLNVLLTLATAIMMLLAGELVGRRLLGSAPIETRALAGIGIVLVWLAGGVAVGLVIGGSIRWWLAATLLVVVGAAVANVRSLRSLAASLPVAITVGLAVIASMAMASPFDPEGQTAPGTIYESRIPNRPADNRLPYRTGQFILHRLDPATEQYFIDWAVTDRTPLTAAAATAVVGPLTTSVPADQLWFRDPATMQWVARDAYGYWMFRSVLIAFNALLPLGVAALGVPWLGRRLGSLGAVVAALFLFSIVETMFTWPKYTATALGAAAVGVLFLRHPWLAGVLAGAAYLSHPVGLIVVGAGIVAGFLLHRTDVRTVVKTAAATAAMVAPWTLWLSMFQKTSSRMVLYPIGWILSSGHALGKELPLAMDQFVDRLPWGPLSDRWTSLWESLSPLYFVRIIDASLRKAAVFGAYDRTIPGMVGLSGVIPLVVGMVESVRQRKAILAGAGTSLGLALAFWGVWPRALGADMLQPVVPFLALAVAYGVCRHPALAWFLPLMALETFAVAAYTVLDGSSGAWESVLTIAAWAVFLTAVSLIGITIARGGITATPVLRWYELAGDEM